MKKLHLVLLFFSIAALVCGCGPTVEVDGRYYRALDEDEIHQLVLFARSRNPLPRRQRRQRPAGVGGERAPDLHGFPRQVPDRKNGMAPGNPGQFGTDS